MYKITKTYLFSPSDSLEPTFGFILVAGENKNIFCIPHSKLEF